MDRVRFREQDIEVLRTQRFEHPHPHVQLKMEALYLRSQGIVLDQILRVCDISQATYYRYVDDYRKGGIDGLKALRFHRPQSELMEHSTTLEAYFLENPPASVNEACAKIKELTGVERKPTQVRRFLHGLGLKPRRVGTIPARADVQAQAEYKKTVWSLD